jgi:ATP-binding cassette, subfamily G (WHITE), eye pigment precursor transporter
MLHATHKAHTTHVHTQLITELGLGKCQHTLVGNDLIRGVSGGERKRVNIAMELVTDPSLVFLDEPTSGLDSFNAQSVMQLLLKLARNNRTIITTIHQPRSSIYQMFDTLMLVSDGRTMYFGPASYAVDYFARQGFPCPPTYNPADFFMDLLATDTRTQNLARVSRARINKLGAAYAAIERGEAPSITDMAASAGHAKSTDALALPSTRSSTRSSPHGTMAGGVSAGLEAAQASGKYAASWLYQFGRLCWRSFRSM